MTLSPGLVRAGESGWVPEAGALIGGRGLLDPPLIQGPVSCPERQHLLSNPGGPLLSSAQNLLGTFSLSALKGCVTLNLLSFCLHVSLFFLSHRLSHPVLLWGLKIAPLSHQLKECVFFLSFLTSWAGWPWGSWLLRLRILLRLWGPSPPCVYPQGVNRHRVWLLVDPCASFRVSGEGEILAGKERKDSKLSRSEGIP